MNKLIWAPVAVAMVTGCSAVPPKQIGDFGTAVSNASGEIAKTYEELPILSLNNALSTEASKLTKNEKALCRKNKDPYKDEEIAVDQLPKCPDTDVMPENQKLKCPKTEEEPKNKEIICLLETNEILITSEGLYSIKPNYTDADIKQFAIIKLSNALDGYAKSLKKIAEAGNPAEITAASIKFYNALKTLDSQEYILKHGADEKIPTERLEKQAKTYGLIASAVDAIGEEIVERKRRTALKEIINQAEPFVELATSAMKEYLQEGSDNLASTLSKNEQTALSESVALVNKEMRAGNLDSFEKKEQLTKLYEQAQSVATTSLRVEKLVELADKINKTHKVMVKVVNKGDFNSMELAESINELDGRYQSFKSTKKLLQECKGTVSLNEKKKYVCNE